MSVYPFRLTRLVVPLSFARKLQFYFVLLLGTNIDDNELIKTFRSELTVDLFDPPQRVMFREQVMKLRAQGLTERQVAAKLGITSTAAQKAAALDRLTAA